MIRNRIIQKIIEILFPKKEEASSVETEEAPSVETTVTKGKINNALLMEISTQMMGISNKYEKDMENKTPGEIAQISAKIAKEMNEVYEKFGITEAEIEAYSEKNG